MKIYPNFEYNTRNIMQKLCKICQAQIKGRSDKLFCSLACKNYYHIRLRKVTRKATGNVDKILHRNRSILLEVLGKDGIKKKVHRKMLDRKKFNYNYITQYHLNTRGKMVNYVYDFSWSVFSDQEVLIVRHKSDWCKYGYLFRTISSITTRPWFARIEIT